MLEVISQFTLGQSAELFATELASPVKDSFVYTTYAGALATPPGGSGVFDVYQAERGEEDGWQTTQHLSFPAPTLLWPLPGGIAADHTYSFQAEGPTVSDLRSPGGSIEPTGIGSLGSEPAAQGRYISEGGKHIVFTTGDEEGQSARCNGCKVLRLEPNAPPTGTGAVYDRAPDGPTHVVSLLPGDTPPVAGQQAFYKGVSKDASAIAFTIGGVLYVRIDNAETLEVAPGNPTFAGISDNGTYLFYVAGKTIHRFDTATKVDVKVNPTGEAEIVNISSDGSHVYFISEQQLDGTKGSAGQPNMYVWSSGSINYIATVVPSDLVSTSGTLENLPSLTNWTDGVFNPNGTEPGPGADSSRTTPDGNVLVFESRAKLTAYDNTETTAGACGDPEEADEGCTEIYRYDVASENILCVSCGPAAAPAEADARLQELNLVGSPFVIHNVSDDGGRVFFETSSSLAAGDTNDANDIYEWNGAEGGSLSLISSGKSPAYPLPEGWESPFAPLPNLLLAITPDGSDVFFTAKESLVPGAGEAGTQAIYDARIGGGFAVTPAQTPCVEERCKPDQVGAGASFPASQSETMAGIGNVKPKRHRKKHRCRKSRRGSSRSKHQKCQRHHKKGAKTSSGVLDSQDPAGAEEGSPKSKLLSDQLQGSPTSTMPSPQATKPALQATKSEEFGIQRAEADLSSPDAGRHPDFTTVFEFNHFNDGNGETASASVENISISLPPGLTGIPLATPTCSIGDFTAFGNCPPETQVGVSKVKVGRPLYTGGTEPVFNLTPPHPEEEVARFGFIAFLYPVFIDVKVRTAGDYGVTAIVHNAPGLGSVIRATTTLWGNPSSDVHNQERLTPFEVACEKPGCKALGGHPSGIPLDQQKGFMTNPSACQGGQLDIEVTTYQHPSEVFAANAPLDSIVNCAGLPFAPEFEAEPTNHVAGAPTGLKTKLVLPQHLGPEEKATATMREAHVTLPEGMQVAAGAANWISTCSEAEVGYHQEVDVACPDNSKLGTATFISPALAEPIEGTIYQRNPTPGHQLGLWLTSDAMGLHIKLPGELEPDPNTGRLTAVFRDLPQVPVEEIDLEVWGGPRAPLENPDSCGTYITNFIFAPHSEDPAASGQDQMQIDEGCSQGFSPTLHAGVTDPVAGHFSPFTFDLTRGDDQQALRGFELHLPDGETAKVKGVPFCSDAAAASASCPTDSRIGTIQATTGPGPDPLQIPQPGKGQPAVYFAGPYQGAPYSIVTEVPAQAGPFDLGVLAVRSALQVDPETAQVTVKADPLPQFFEGVGIAYRQLHAVVDRPEFNLNPTDCSEMAVTADVTSTQGTVAHPAARFQVDGCKQLKYTPKLKLSFRGQTQRTGNPAVRAVLTQKPNQANSKSATVLLPKGEFIDNAHINNPCTMVQFRADNCPKSSILGTVQATTPLLGEPLKGNVYFRSNGGARELPDIVADLRGPIHIVLVGYIDAVKTGPETSRVRTRFLHVPDAPVTKFTMSLFGGKKGLIENSTDLCRGTHRAQINLRAQNGRAINVRPRLETSCPKKKLGKHKHHKKHR